jgi:hypothetical protein
MKMAHIDFEQWACTADLNRFRVELRDQVNEIKNAQVRDLFARKLIKHQAMFPN